MNKKIKKIVCSISIAALLSCNTALAMETIKLPVDVNEKVLEEIKFTMNDKNYKVGDTVKSLDSVPYIKNGRTMLPVSYVAEAVGVNKESIEWDNETKTVTIFKNNKIIQLRIGSNIISVDGNKIKMDTVAEIKDRRTMLPLSYIAKALDIEVKWSDSTKTATIFIEKQQEIKKEETKNWDYTYDDLLEKALRSSRDLKKAEMDVDRTEIVRDEAEDKVDYIPRGTGNGLIDAQADGAYQMSRGADVQHRMAEKTVGMVKDTIAYNLKNAYYNVLKNEDAKKVANMAVDLANEDLNHAKLKYEQGLVSELEKRQAERDCENAKKQYDLAVKELEKSYEKLNDLIGLDVKSRYTLKDEVAFEEIKNVDVDSHIIKTIEESPVIWGLKQKIDLKDLGVKLYVFNAGQDPYDAKEIDVKTAEIDLNSAKQAYDQSLRNLYTSLKQLKDQYEKEKISLEKAKDDLKIAKVNVEIGNALPITLEKATLQLENTKKQLREKIMDYNKTAMIYEKLWVGSPSQE